jgi:hypothetical protein
MVLTSVSSWILKQKYWIGFLQGYRSAYLKRISKWQNELWKASVFKIIGLVDKDFPQTHPPKSMILKICKSDHKFLHLLKWLPSFNKINDSSKKLKLKFGFIKKFILINAPKHSFRISHEFHVLLPLSIPLFSLLLLSSHHAKACRPPS